MTRTDRLYAIVEELRVVAPRPRSGRWLAERFEVSVRTIERDVSALQLTGSPIWAEPGRTGGYCLDAQRTLPPVNLTPSEAVALAVALERMTGSPFAQPARSALRKLLAAMQADDARAAHDLAARVHLLPSAAPPPQGVPAQVSDALSTGRVLRLGYLDRDGEATVRDVEPLGYVGSPDHWYLIGWCRLRDGVRAFRMDRITSSAATSEVAAPRVLAVEDLRIPSGDARTVTLD